MHITAILLIIAGIISCDSAREASMPHIVGGALVEHDDPIARNTVKVNDGCTGILINLANIEHRLPGSLVASAAHCFVGAATTATIALGTSTELDDAVLEGKIVLHPDYAGGVNNDLALIYLADKVPDYAQTVSIRPPSAPLPVGSEVILAGYGRHEEKDEESGEWITALDGKLRKTTTQINKFNAALKTIHYKTPNDGINSGCHGDSGGPMFYRGTNGLELVGVTHGPDKTEPEYVNCFTVGVYSDIRLQMPWLEGVVKRFEEEL